jgi:uncharacterized membrane protein YdbT with pleckstrin-like domain
MAKSYLQNLLSEREKIILVARQHWFILVSSIFFELAAIIIIFAATVTLAIVFQLYALIIAAIGFVLMIIPVFSMIHDILVWSNHQYLVTNRRVMQISGVINKAITDSSLEKVNDVKMEQSALGRVFGYGDIEILTASELGVNVFKRIEDPVEFKQAMINAKEKLDYHETDLPKQEGIPQLIAQLEALREQGVLTNEEFQQKKAQLLAKI